MTFLGILIGIVVLAAAYGATMCGYFALRRKMPGAKFFVEIVIMGVAVAFSFCVKLTVYMLQEGDNIEDGAAALFFAVYKAVAGLALDGNRLRLSIGRFGQLPLFGRVAVCGARLLQRHLRKGEL